MNICLIACGIFYGVLCVFSIVTGIIYMSGKRKLNPLELSENFLSKIKDIKVFARKMGLVTFIVGLLQGLTAYSILICHNVYAYGMAIGFTLFSIASVVFKLKGKINVFPLLKLLCYLIIFVILILKSTRGRYF